MRNPIFIKICTSITLLVVFLLMPLTSHADMLGALQRLERDTRYREQRIRQNASTQHLLKKPEERMSAVMRTSQPARRPQSRNWKGRDSQRFQTHCPAFWQELKAASQGRLPEIRKMSHRQARQEQRGRPRPPKTPERILNKFVSRIQHLAVTRDASTAQYMSEEQAVDLVPLSLPDHQSSSCISESSSLPRALSLHIISVLRL